MTLGYPNERWGMVKLARKDQYIFMRAEPRVFVPAKGAWGRWGASIVHFKAAILALQDVSCVSDSSKRTTGSASSPPFWAWAISVMPCGPFEPARFG